MSLLKNEDFTVLIRHQRALSHLRERKRSDRIAIFLGAGASIEFGFPSWSQLIERIEGEAEFKDYTKPRGSQSLTFRTQALIQHLQRKSCSKSKQIDAAAERIAKHKWISIVHRCLYEGTSTDEDLCRHPYLGSFLGLIKESPLTINYNFDDCIERMLAIKFSAEQSLSNERIYETVWDPSTQYQRSKGVIYHPNGFLPKRLIDGYSNDIVFAEGEFADQLIQSMHGHYSTLISHLTRYTSLLVGLSLEDSTLRHLLRQNTHLNPGHVHYWLKHCKELPDQDLMDEEQEVNFEVYGIITLHLTEQEFQSFGRLLACDDSEYTEAADRYGVSEKRIFYVTGAVGAGKSSVVQKMKSLSWIGEWIDSKPESLAKPHIDLNLDERNELDNWVSSQFRKKDFKISDIKGGLIICDRSPIDPLAFAKTENLKSRTKDHLDIMNPKHSHRRLSNGHVIFLSATGAELLSRARHRNAGANVKYLASQQKTLKSLYQVPNPGVTEISTCGRTLSQVVRNVAKVIHLGKYEEYCIQGRLEELKVNFK